MTNYDDHIRNIVQGLPENPGVYQYIDVHGKIIYVGKAKNLKKRVSSYFNSQGTKSQKINVMIRKIYDIKYIVVESESDALLLENNLIKKYQPRYNVNLKDDKTFPWICIKNEKFPRVFMTRDFIRDGSEYFGPYTSVGMVRTILEFIKQIYKLRTCNYNLDSDKIEEGKYKVCLEYHIGNCIAPCVGKQSEEEYNDSIAEIRELLKGNIGSLLKYLKELMQKYANEYEYEKADSIKNKIKLIEKYRSKSTVVNPSINNVDVFSIVQENDFAFVNFLRVVNGAIIQANTMELKKKLDEPEKDLLTIAMIEMKERVNSLSKEIIVPFEMDIEMEEFKFIVPKIGDKLKLLELSKRNARYYMEEQIKRRNSLKSYQDRIEGKLLIVKKDLRLNMLPIHIECFDNSNIQGSNPVASCVVFKNGKPSKLDYRHYNIKTVSGPDDFASMKEVVYRRYKRLQDENLNLPQLIVIDGGKGQLNAALKSLEELNLKGKIAIIGIAKRLEEIYFPGDEIPIYLDKNSITLKLIQHIRNEAHRFGINFHRSKRSKGMIDSELTHITGIGKDSIQKLLINFKTVENVRNAKFEELENVVKKAKAKIIWNYFHSL
ncbi:MAG: excinuclease ABC subunit UvrC [bacterium]